MNTAFITTFIVLCISGIVNSSYLVYKHYKKKPLMCPLNHNCSIVTESKWSKMFFIRNEILGLIFYIAMFLSILILMLYPSLSSILKIIILLATGFSLLFSIFLVLIQKYVIKDYCFYCLISAVITLLIFFNSAYIFRYF